MILLTFSNIFYYLFRIGTVVVDVVAAVVVVATFVVGAAVVVLGL